MMVEERQRPSVGQVTPLPTNRQTSRIPKGDITPGHQDKGAANWEYPSQQMFFNAMKRKGHGPKENEMSVRPASVRCVCELRPCAASVCAVPMECLMSGPLLFRLTPPPPCLNIHYLISLPQTVVGMHNAVNERSWRLLMEWEKQLHPETAESVRLLKFAGDSKKFSPKARFRELLGYVCTDAPRYTSA